jgi:hypothetical protein
MPRWILIAIAIAIAVILLNTLWRRKEPITAMIETIKGVIVELPADEATRKGLDVEVLSLARAMQSEESNVEPRKAVGYATKRHAKSLGLSVTTLVTTTSKLKDGTHAFPVVRGHYSRQQYAKYCSTFEAPNAETLELAQSVLDGSANDPSQGAELWDNPELQDKLALLHPFDTETHHGYHTSAEIADKRQAAGFTAVTMNGTTTRFWTKSA